MSLAIKKENECANKMNRVGEALFPHKVEDYPWNIGLQKEGLANFEETEEANDINVDLVGLYLAEICKKPLLSKEEETHYATLAKEGDFAARQKMIEHNLRFVVSIAKRFLNKGLPFLDLIEEGNLGLIHALDKFEPQRGFRFSTYAAWWIRCSIESALHECSRTIRVPVHIHLEHKRILKAKVAIEKKNNDGRKAALAEIAMSTGMEQFRIERTMKLWADTSQVQVGSNEEEQSIFFTNIPCPESAQPEARLMELEALQTIRSLMNRLSPKERFVITSRFGLEDDSPKTFDWIASEMQVTPERVRQIQMKGLQKLRQLFPACKLKQQAH